MTRSWKGTAKRWRKSLVLIALCLTPCAMAVGVMAQRIPVSPADVNRIEAELSEFTGAPRNPDDPFVVASIREAIAGSRGGSGGIGACLVREATGEIVELGHNRQYSPHFRSDLHAEMDLLDRYEDRVRTSRSSLGPGVNPRQMYQGLVLYSSLEPCPMCTARIINTGITRVLFAAPDPEGGMALRIDALPPFWRDLAAGTTFALARNSPRLTEMAATLFGHAAPVTIKTQPPAASGQK